MSSPVSYFHQIPQSINVIANNREALTDSRLLIREIKDAPLIVLAKIGPDYYEEEPTLAPERINNLEVYRWKEDASRTSLEEVRPIMIVGANKTDLLFTKVMNVSRPGANLLFTFEMRDDKRIFVTSLSNLERHMERFYLTFTQ